MTIGTPADESGPFPPGPNHRHINAVPITVKLQMKLDPLHLVAASGMRTKGIMIMDVRRSHLAETPFTIYAVQLRDFSGSRNMERHNRCSSCALSDSFGNYTIRPCLITDLC